jgi:transposase InsO family protein
MFSSVRHLIGWILSGFGSRQDLVLENLALRQQLLALQTKRPRRRLSARHKLFWVLLRKLWSEWQKPLILVTPRTVVAWHRAGFRLYWKCLSRTRRVGGRKPVGREIRELIFRMAAENPTWGAPRIHGELLKLGFKISEPTVSRWLQRMPRSPDLGKRWLTFLRNHPEVIAAMDFFTVPTLTFGVLYCFFIIDHERRRILRCNVTCNPSSLWIVQKMREAWPYTQAQKFLLFDHDSKFDRDVIDAGRTLGSEPIRTAFRSPWQNGVAERWVGSCRRDLLDHVIVLNERHLKRLMAEYIRYYHEDRTHLGLAKDTPAKRPMAPASSIEKKIQSFSRLGGLHHRYAVAA